MSERVKKENSIFSKVLWVAFQLFICFCIMSIVVALIYTFSNGRTPIWWFSALTKSSCNTSTGIAHINFVDNELFVPSKAIGACSAWDKSTRYDYIPAVMEIYLSLSDFKPLKAKDQINDNIQDGELRIYLEGKRRDIDQIDPYLTISETKLEFSAFTEKDPFKKAYNYIGKSDMDVLHYQPVRSTSYQDKYIYYNEARDLEFIVECGMKYSICECTSNHESLFENVTFRYCYNQAHIDDAVRIDRKVKEFLKTIKKLY
jgi:hypothetical protein